MSMHRTLFDRFTSPAALLIALCAAGCQTFLRVERPEPPTVIVRNFCGLHVSRVTLSRIGKDPHETYTYASVAPLPLGASRTAAQPADREPLPNDIRVEWVDNAGQLHTREVSLLRALAFATGGPDEALVFELRPVDRVVVDIERTR